ncbi:Integral membrane protein OS=Tsukamurella paurometabola (strain ATCC 8368 / DSM / CCUG 35730/ CIP 100753 / JCM 10117 / KCTC 9821 / NBRC 16120 / NCIMB 702349/ NCTC 13040) OX=521096 GN=Tpau_3961 PE=4 SV=1 [Tsukamurella paurometabola]|uniref:Uncharacterized protein n=1 Tax=Tsukamurella paurometabola (strain ATCC 8368 / DSM 20162 / CCUG 35730 / CIP 100753 / JCM 10117 / KCTC 9821 / NBRC 16120 / NCIMB 702349 / NCTC 13040) TaxID=521096 RepID=D5UMQ8_TSUPD|nr:hypothetical protein [Tsukamurella paurometabola]ADG80532.1 hypothetical protein Tpau_3961 [Tsukamurella paurometabola DSM 20162]SUP39996.1 Uncharacterised protein [Tsukamurella paurometabola]
MASGSGSAPARSGRRRGGGVWLWALVSLAAGGGAIALDVFAIIQTSALLGTQGYPGNFPSSPLGVRTIMVMVLAIAGLVVCALMALTGLFALFGVRWAAIAFALVTFAGFLIVAGEVLLGIPRDYTDPVSQYGVNYNGQPLDGLPLWGAVIVMFLFLASLVLTRSAYRYALARSASSS